MRRKLWQKNRYVLRHANKVIGNVIADRWFHVRRPQLQPLIHHLQWELNRQRSWKDSIWEGLMPLETMDGSKRMELPTVYLYAMLLLIVSSTTHRVNHRFTTSQCSSRNTASIPLQGRLCISVPGTMSCQCIVHQFLTLSRCSWHKFAAAF